MTWAAAAWPWILCAGARQLVLLLLIIVRGRRLQLPARTLGTLTTVVQLFAIVAIVWPGPAAQAVYRPLAVAAGALGLASVIDQIAHARRKVGASLHHVTAAGGGGPLVHQLAPHFAALRAFRTRRALEASPLWHQIGSEVERVVDAVERRDREGLTPPAGRLRAVGWNIQRGTELGGLRDALAGDPELASADVLLLSEVDIGMGRSRNRNVARELADALGMSYAFAVSYLALEDDDLENPDGLESTLALAGSAILSRAPLLRVLGADLPALRDKFESSEKRLGRKRAVVAEIATASGPVVIAQAHLDSTASSVQRARQLAAVIDAADSLGVPRILLGGDLNTTTYQLGSVPELARDLLHKLFVLGFDRTIDHYMTPELAAERPVFDLLAARGLAIEGFNDRSIGTTRYDLNEPYAQAKVRDAVGDLLTRWLVRRLRSRGGVVEARLDWFAGRGLVPQAARVPRPRPGGLRASDHEPIVVDVAL